MCVAGDKAQAIASLWRRLPEGEQMRCHLPPYGLRFFADKELLAQASICWECNNIFGSTPAGPFAFQFDGEARVSIELLATVRDHGCRAER